MDLRWKSSCPCRWMNYLGRDRDFVKKLLFLFAYFNKKETLAVSLLPNQGSRLGLEKRSKASIIVRAKRFQPF